MLMLLVWGPHLEDSGLEVWPGGPGSRAWTRRQGVANRGCSEAQGRETGTSEWDQGRCHGLRSLDFKSNLLAKPPPGLRMEGSKEEKSWERKEPHRAGCPGRRSPRRRDSRLGRCLS